MIDAGAIALALMCRDTFRFHGISTRPGDAPARGTAADIVSRFRRSRRFDSIRRMAYRRRLLLAPALLLLPRPALARRVAWAR